MKQILKKIPENLTFTQKRRIFFHSKAFYLGQWRTLPSSVKLQRVGIIKPFPSCVSWQGEPLSKMKRFQANPFFSVPLIGSLIYCCGNLQEGVPTVSGEGRVNLVDFKGGGEV